MSIDTAAKRRSAASLLPFHKAGIIPDGTIGDTDRIAIGWVYNGLISVAGNIFKIIAVTTLHRNIKTVTASHRYLRAITTLHRIMKIITTKT